MSDPQDILALIVNDPAKLLEVVREIDVNGDHTLGVKELTAWMAKHADALNVQGHNLASDLKNFGASAVEGAKPFRQDDWKYTQDVSGPDAYPKDVTKYDGTVLHKKGELVQHKAGDLDSKRIREVRDVDERHFTMLDREVVAITEAIQQALTEAQKKASGEIGKALSQYKPEDMHSPGFENLAPLTVPGAATDQTKQR